MGGLGFWVVGGTGEEARLVGFGRGLVFLGWGVPVGVCLGLVGCVGPPGGGGQDWAAAA